MEPSFPTRNSCDSVDSTIEHVKSDGSTTADPADPADAADQHSDSTVASTSPTADESDDEYCDTYRSNAIANSEAQLSSEVPVQMWDEDKFEMVKFLQDAKRNKGQVSQMRDLENGCFVAVKRMPNSWVKSGPEEFMAEQGGANERPWFDISVLRFLNRVSYVYAVDFKGVFQDEEDTYVVTSFATQGDMFTWCDVAPRPGPLREQAIQPLFQQVASAVKCLHKYGIVHRDISLENILLTGGDAEGIAVKLCDFGMAGLARKEIPVKCGKPSYQAPEMHEEAPQDPIPMDIFSMGVVLFAMAAHDYPWLSTQRGECNLFGYVSKNGLRRFMQRRTVRKGDGEHLADVFSGPLQELTLGLLTLKPEDRLTLRKSHRRASSRATSSSSAAELLPLGRSTVASADDVRRSAWELAWLAGS